MKYTKKFQILTNVKSRWERFESSVVCPVCLDNKGHAGVFPNPVQGLSGFQGYCFKCSEPFTNIEVKNKTKEKLEANGVSASLVLSTHQYIRAGQVHHLNFKWRHSTSKRILAFLRGSVPSSIERAEELLKLRAYKPEYIKHLIKRGFSYFEKLEEAVTLVGSDPSSASVKEVSDPESLLKMYEVANPNVRGLLIPLYHSDSLIGFTIRTDMLDGKYIPLVHSSKNLTKKQEEQRVMYSYSYVTAKKDDPNSPLYMTEGAMKAEAVAYFFKNDCLGALSTNTFLKPDLLEVLQANKHRTIIIAPDRDYKKKFPVANAYWKLIDWLDKNDFDFKILHWSHFNKQIDADLKGIDDAIMQDQVDQGVGFTEMSIESFFTNMDRKVRYDVVRKITGGAAIKPGAIISRETASILDGKVIVDDTKILAEPDQFYSLDNRVESTMRALAKHKIVIDISPTGSGKSHGVGLLETTTCTETFLEERVYSNPKFKRYGKQISMFTEEEVVSDKKNPLDVLFNELVQKNKVNRICYVSQSPINNTVSTLDRFSLRLGRNATGWTYDVDLKKWRPAKEGEATAYEPNCPQAADVIKLSQNRQVLHIQKEVCLKCPLKKDCTYLKEFKKSGKSSYLRTSIQSLNVKEGDIVVLDDPGSIEFFSTMSIQRQDAETLFNLMGVKTRWKPYSIQVQKFVNQILELVRQGKTLKNAVKLLSESNAIDPGHAYRWLTLDEPDKIATQKIRVRESGGLEYAGRYNEFFGVKRWFFTFLRIITGDQVGDMYYDPKTQSWVLKGIDPKFKDMCEKATAILILDATANKDFFESIFGVRPHVITAKGDPFENIKTTVVEGFNTTYGSMLGFQEQRDRVKAKIEYINKYVEETGEKVGVLTFKSLLNAPDTKDLWHPDIVKGYWFCDERASNLFYAHGCTTIFLVGVPTPNISAIAAEAEISNELEPIWVARPYGITKPDGSYNYMIQKDVSDKKTRDILWYKKASSYVQAAGRLRSLQRPNEQLKLVVLDSVPLPFRVDEVIRVGKEEMQEYIDLGQDQVKQKVRYFDGLVQFLKETKSKKGSALTIDTVEYISGKMNFSSFIKVGVNVKTCSTIDDIIKKVIEARDKVSSSNDSLYSYLKPPVEEDTNIIDFSQRSRTPIGLKVR